MMRERFLRSASLSHICWDDERSLICWDDRRAIAYLLDDERSLICWDDRRAIATGFSVGVLILHSALHFVVRTQV
jgi:hypothetical protein